MKRNGKKIKVRREWKVNPTVRIETPKKGKGSYNRKDNKGEE